jgi:hypothetical protein
MYSKKTDSALIILPVFTKPEMGGYITFAMTRDIPCSRTTNICWYEKRIDYLRKNQKTIMETQNRTQKLKTVDLITAILQAFNGLRN